MLVLVMVMVMVMVMFAFRHDSECDDRMCALFILKHTPLRHLHHKISE